MSGAPEPPRLRSIDALRGFDMLWIAGGREALAAIAAATGWSTLTRLERQTHHVDWHGFTLWDGVFPLFLFLAGASLPLSFAKRRAAGATRARLARHALRRGLTLVALGVLYNGLLAFDFATLRYASVLGRIGLAWMVAAWLVLFLSVRAQVVAAAAILVGYWAALTFVPVPGQGAPSLAPGQTLVDWVDRALVPGRLHRGVRDPEGLAGTLPAVVTALAGSWAGRRLARPDLAPAARSAGLAVAGVAALLLGWLWHPWFPVNKNLWTSSFVLVTAGGSALLLAVFHLVVDVRGWRAWSFPLVVVGANSIAIYLAHAFVDFERVADVLFGAATARRLHPALLPSLALAIEWCLLWTLYRRRLFLRV